MSDHAVDPSVPYKIPRHLAQQLISTALQAGSDYRCGLLYPLSDGSGIRAGNAMDNPSALCDTIGHADPQPVGIYQCGTIREHATRSLLTGVRDACAGITLLLNVCADTRGRIEIDGFTLQQGGLQALDVQLEEDGTLYPDRVNR